MNIHPIYHISKTRPNEQIFPFEEFRLKATFCFFPPLLSSAPPGSGFSPLAAEGSAGRWTLNTEHWTGVGA